MQTATRMLNAFAGATDTELLTSLDAALAELYDRHKTIAYSIAYRITADSALAEDVVQDAFLTAWRDAGLYVEARGSVKTWLLAIVHHRAIDAIRRRRATTNLPEATDFAWPAEMTTPDVWPAVEAGLDAVTARAALGVLPVAQRTAIEMAYFGGFSLGEIAERTGTPLGTVKSRMRLGLSTMRRFLEAGTADLAGEPATAERAVVGAGWRAVLAADNSHN